MTFFVIDFFAIIIGVKVIDFLSPNIYIATILVGFIFSSIHVVAKKNKYFTENIPQIISNDNLSLGGQNSTVNSINIQNIGGTIAKITSVTSDLKGEINIVDNHYMDNFIIGPNEKLNLMINEEKIISGILKNNKAVKVNTLVENWKQPFFIYVWFQDLTENYKAYSQIEFQSGKKYIKNLGWKIIKQNQ